MKEIWKDIAGFEGLYQVSTYGRVKSLKYGKEVILKQQCNNAGYMRVSLYKDGEVNRLFIHKIVALTFIPNNAGHNEINHKNEDKSNNSIENIEWCNRTYNMNYGTAIDRKNKKMSKPVLQFSINGIFIKEYPSIMQVHREFGIKGSNISQCCKGVYSKACGYVWRFK